MKEDASRVRSRSVLWLAVAYAIWMLWGCAHHLPLPQESQQWVYQAEGDGDGPLVKWAPAFVVYGHSQRHNRIGRPTAIRDKNGMERISVDPDLPSLYVMERTFETARATYTNQIYRVHFPKVPFSLLPFNITAGKNVGVLVVVTFDSAMRPVLVTTVGTCGCYMVIVPTQFLSVDAYPLDWNPDATLDKYGERLPALLTVEQIQEPRIVVHLRPDVHRVMDLEIRDNVHLSSDKFLPHTMTIHPMASLDHLPMKNGTRTSFFHQEGRKKGYVKGAVKPWESFLMSLISLDFYVGTDKAYADTAGSENPFYTSLKPWRRQDSNMWDFARFLNYWGWRL